MALTGRPYTKGDMQTRRENIERLLYYISTGLSQKAAALVMGVSQQCVCRWIDETPGMKETIRDLKHGHIGAHFEIDKNLNAFIDFVRVHVPRLYADIIDAKTKFNNTIKHVCMEPITQEQAVKIEGIFSAISLSSTDQVRRIREIADNKKSSLNELNTIEAGQLINYLKKVYKERLINASKTKTGYAENKTS